MLNLELLGESSWRGPGSARRPPFYKRTWFSAFLALVILCAMGAFAVFVFIIQPLRDKAATYDLEECRKLEAASVIFDRNGGEIGRIYVMNRTPVTLADIPVHLQKALMSQEDSRFRTHDGVDYLGIVRAVWLTIKVGRVTQGASTLTQQLARNTFELRERSIKRKLLEAFLAQRIEKYFTKDEIMELYLNRIFFGSGNGQQFYGIQSAAKGYFGKDAKALNLEESATIVGLIKAPNLYSPILHPQASIKARNLVFHRMLEEGFITLEDEQSLTRRPMITATQVIDSRLTYVYDEVSRQVKRIFGVERAATGGFNIYTTIDPVLQRTAEEAVQRRLKEVESRPGYEHQTYQTYRDVLSDFRRRLGKNEIDPNTPKPLPQYLQGAALVLDNADGAILAVAGGRDYTHSQLNRALASPRPMGTAFVPFVYATAFATPPQFFPGSPFADAPFENSKIMIGAVGGGILGEWGMEAEKGTYTMGHISARETLVHSRNSGVMRLAYQAFPGVTEDRLNLSPLKDVVRKMGIESPLADTPPTVLGASSARLDEACLAYSVFANGGTRAKEVHLITKITDAQNQPMYTLPEDATTPVNALDEIAAWQVNSCLVDALDRGTASAARSEFGLKKFPAAGKTGTHYNFKDLWFMGYTSAVTCGVWVGFDKPKTIYTGAFSSRIAMPIWCDIMNASVQKHKPEEFKTPDGMVRMELCRKSGMKATDFCFEKVRDSNGRERSVRDTFFELVRPGTIANESCTEHEGEGIALDLQSFLSPIGQANSATPGLTSVQVPNVDPVHVQSTTIVGADPYNAIKAIVQFDDATKEGGGVKRAVAVDEEQAAEVIPIKLEPPNRGKLEQ